MAEVQRQPDMGVQAHRVAVVASRDIARPINSDIKGGLVSASPSTGPDLPIQAQHAKFFEPPLEEDRPLIAREPELTNAISMAAF
jgi:hypothetical protein